MAPLDAGELLKKYAHYLRVLNAWEPAWQGDRLDMLHSGEVFDLFWLRDQLAEANLSNTEQRALQRADELLLKHRTIIAANLPPKPEGTSRSRWWWHLDEGALAGEAEGKAQRA